MEITQSPKKVFTIPNYVYRQIKKRNTDAILMRYLHDLHSTIFAYANMYINPVKCAVSQGWPRCIRFISLYRLLVYKIKITTLSSVSARLCSIDFWLMHNAHHWSGSINLHLRTCREMLPLTPCYAMSICS